LETAQSHLCYRGKQIGVALFLFKLKRVAKDLPEHSLSAILIMGKPNIPQIVHPPLAATNGLFMTLVTNIANSK